MISIYFKPLIIFHPFNYYKPTRRGHEGKKISSYVFHDSMESLKINDLLKYMKYVNFLKTFDVLSRFRLKDKLYF